MMFNRVAYLPALPESEISIKEQLEIASQRLSPEAGKGKQQI